MNDTPGAAVPDRYRSLFENSPDPILVIEGDRFVDCNQAAVDLLGYADRQELLLRHPSEISPEYQPDGQPSLEKANAILADIGDRGSHRFEWMHVKADGSLIPVDVSMTAIPARDGFALHIVWRDLTARKQLERELRHTQRMEALGTLAAGIAHDFNNTLVPVVTYSDLLARALADLPRERRWAEEIKRAGTLAGLLVEKLSAVSRMDEPVHMPKSLDLGRAVTASGGMLRRLVGEDVVIVFDCPDDPVWVRMGAGDVDQILLNLASNARDAMPTGGSIRIGVSQEDHDGIAHVRLAFTDDGAGMDDRTVDQAFVPFFTTKERGRGTGLGLSSVYELVVRAGGRIGIISRVGEGTTVEMLVPVSSPEADEPAADQGSGTSSDADTAGGATGRILVVEDDPAIVRLARELLEAEGYEVEVAGDGATALECVAARPADLVLSDVVMPRMSGPEMVETMRADGVDVPVVFMSGYVDDRLVAHGFDPAGVVLLRKPFTGPELLRCVGDALAASPSRLGQGRSSTSAS